MPEDDGVRLRAVDGRRSSQRVGREVFASAAAAAAPEVAGAIRAEGDWRKRYLHHLRALVEAGVASSRGALDIAAEGLAAVHERIELARGGGALPLRAAVSAGSAPFETAVVDGTATGRPEPSLPYGGEILRGDAIRRRLDRWTERGIIEPSCAEAVEKVLANPDWLDLSDRRFLLLGAASEMGALEPLSRWGATILAVDVRRPDLWRRIASAARQGRGRLLAPVRGPGRSGADLPAAAGADLLTEAPEIRSWAEASSDGALTVADSTYADGTTFLLLAGAVDAIVAELASTRAEVSLAYLATPTDIFAVPEDVVAGATIGPARRWLAPARGAMRGLTAGRLYRPNYRTLLRGGDGRRWGVADCLVPQQGPNYALAKNLQRWRAMTALESGAVVSANVAPPTRTRSVLKNRVLAAAYRGAGGFGVEVFEPPTSRWLMAMLLVHDLRNPPPAATAGRHPFDLYVDTAAHGGIWRMRHEPRSVLPLAVARGMAGGR